MHLRIPQILFGIGSFLLGGIIGAIVENQITSGINAAYLAILVLTVTLSTTMSVVFLSLRNRETHDDKVLSSIASIEKRLGLKVLYQELKDIGRGGAGKEDYLAKLMREADFEILEVGRSEVHKQEINPDLPPQNVRQRYYDSILERVEEQAAKGIEFVYKRIVQFPQVDSDDVFRSLGDRVYVDHCKRMITCNQSRGIRAYVKRTLLTSPIPFLIIDRECLVISVDEIRYLRNTSEQYLKGEIVIHDPQQELIKVFLREWERIENSPYTQTATIDEF